MELSKPRLHSSDLSLFYASGSQILRPSYSLSLPSEPPELGNWFPSYQYESPVLETNDKFRDSAESEIGKDKFLMNDVEREKEESLRSGFKEIGKKDEVIVGQKLKTNEVSEDSRSFGDVKEENQSLSEILAPSYSLSLLSEPPELGNWFPSYQYESPILETNDKFGDFAESEIGKDKFLMYDVEREKEESLGSGFKEIGKKDEVIVGQKLKSNEVSEYSRLFGDDKGENQSLSENIDSSYSPSLLSEPIHVRNWFPSYVYESPTLDTSDGFKDSLYKETECEDGSNREKAEDYGEFRRTRSSNGVQSSNGLVYNDNYCGDNKQELQPLYKDDPTSEKRIQILSGKSDLCFGSSLKKCSKYETFQNHLAKDVGLSNFDEEHPECRLKSSSEIEIMPLNVQGSSSSSAEKSSEKLILRMENGRDLEMKGHRETVGLFSPESNLKSVLTTGATMRKSIRRCNGKENDGKEISKDVFVTTRKGRFTKADEENVVQMAKGNRQGTVSPAGGEDSVVERKALAERTNFQLAGMTEITGKWQCPQKRKPNLGPPLKQLRLEQWVRKL